MARYAVTEEAFAAAWGSTPAKLAGIPAEELGTVLDVVCGNGLHRALDALVDAGALARAPAEQAQMALNAASWSYMCAVYGACDDAGDAGDDWGEVEARNLDVRDRTLRVIAALLSAGVAPTRSAILAMTYGTDHALGKIDLATPLARWYGTPEFDAAVLEKDAEWGRRYEDPIDATLINGLLAAFAPGVPRRPPVPRGPPVPD